MSGLVEAIKDQLPPSCFVKICRKEGCSVNLKGAPTPRVIVDFDRPGSPLGPNDIRCDYLFVADEGRGWVVPLEFTAGTKSETIAVAQLQAGAVIADKYIPDERVPDFKPIVVGKLRKKVARRRKQLKKSLVIFRGQAEPLIRIDSGKLLSNALT